METLYRKYRPQVFSEVVGQQPVVEILERAIKDNKVGHAYLFCGPRGTGKTTMARLLAKAFVCENGEGALPDGTCEACKAVASGRHSDVYELDAASRTGVDAVREEIVNRVNFAPAQARAKIYIIDEVHMLSTAAFNALLKTLEEPPSHVIFVLCTTDPQKIPATVLSRVHRFDFKNIERDQVVAHLVHVVEREGWIAEPLALEAIAAHARGAMRNALSLLEQLSIFGSGQITFANTQVLFGEESDARVQTALSLLAKRKLADLYIFSEQLVSQGVDAMQFTEQLVRHLMHIVAAFELKQTPEEFMSSEEFAVAKKFAQAFEKKSYAMQALVLADDAHKALRNASNAEVVLEVLFTRMILAGGETREETPTQEIEQKAFAPQQVSESKLSVQQKVTASESTSQSVQPLAEHDSVKAAEKIREWKTIVRKVQEKSIAFGALLLSSQLKEDDGQTLTISIPFGNAFTMKQLHMPENEQIMHEVVEKELGPRKFSYVEENQMQVEPSEQTPLDTIPVTALESIPSHELNPEPEPVEEKNLFEMAREVFGDGVKVIPEGEE